MEIAAELDGLLWKVVAHDGQPVEEDETIMIIESMKMEIPVTTPMSGTLTRILVREGDVVREGQVLAIVE
ncbi:MAG: biotin/lipoyl-binding carrier protein [Candidatus Dormibacteria bacterium]|jgi:acetyl-CoA carboxylase biotin carboxyl carrier protein